MRHPRCFKAGADFSVAFRTIEQLLRPFQDLEGGTGVLTAVVSLHTENNQPVITVRGLNNARLVPKPPLTCTEALSVAKPVK